MKWSDVGNIIGRAAPVVGTLLGGPAGAAVGALVSSALGVQNDPESVNAALSSNPDAIVRIQELQTNAKVQLQQLAVTAENNRLQAEASQYAAEAADRDSARKLAAAQPRDIIRPTITILVLCGALFMVLAVFLGWSSEMLKDPVASLTVGTMIGVFFGELKQVMGFYFGMTKESQKQNAIVTTFAVEPGTVSKPEK